MQRPLLLNGFMASGKSSVGRRLAERTGSPFVDLDSEIEAILQTSIDAFFKEHGEVAFRKVEAEQLQALLNGWQTRFPSPPVVALGGGALLQRDVRVRALRDAVVVTLMVSPRTVAVRVAAKGGRPLLEGADVEARAQSLLEIRARSYFEAHAVLETDDADVGSLVEQVLEVWRTDPIAVAAEEHSYAVEVGRGLLVKRLPNLLAAHTSALLVTDRTVFQLHGSEVLAAVSQGRAVGVCELEPGELHKNVAGLSQIWDAAHAHALDRKSLVVALGGGVVTDMAGFAAATWMRGVAWVALPTTLLSMVDAAVGGKTAIDFKDAKNSVGAFWQPKRVLCDVDLLSTESPRGFVSGLAEVVKAGLIGDPQLFAICRDQSASILVREPARVEDLVRRSIRVKAHVVSVDQRESGVRATLNLGHTIGHALESDAGYTALTHGEAVSLGLVAALKIGERLGLTPQALTTEVRHTLAQLQLPTTLDPDKLRSAVKLLARDKKRTGDKLRFVVAKGVGEVATVMLALSELERLTAELADSLSG